MLCKLHMWTSMLNQACEKNASSYLHGQTKYFVMSYLFDRNPVLTAKIKIITAQLRSTREGTYPGWGGGHGGWVTYLAYGVTYLGHGGYLPWGVPILDKGTYFGWGYLSWTGGTYPGTVWTDCATDYAVSRRKTFLFPHCVYFFLFYLLN